MKDHLTSALAQLNGSADWNERTGGIVSAKLTPFESRDVLIALNELQRRAEIAETENAALRGALERWQKLADMGLMDVLPSWMQGTVENIAEQGQQALAPRKEAGQ